MQWYLSEATHFAVVFVLNEMLSFEELLTEFRDCATAFYREMAGLKVSNQPEMTRRKIYVIFSVKTAVQYVNNETVPGPSKIGLSSSWRALGAFQSEPVTQFRLIPLLCALK